MNVRLNEPIERLVDASYSEKRAIKDAGFSFVTDLFRAAHNDLKGTVIRLKQGGGGWSERRLIEILVVQSSAEVERVPLVRRVWVDVVAGLLILSLVFLIPWVATKSRWFPDYQEQVVVKEGQVVPAFHHLTGTEVTRIRRPAQTGTVTEYSYVTGRYALTPLSLGVPIASSDLSEPWEGESVITIPINPASGDHLRKGRVARLLLSPKVLGAAPQSFEVLLLSVIKEGETSKATIAVKEEDVERLNSSLGLTEAHLIQSAQ